MKYNLYYFTGNNYKNRKCHHYGSVLEYLSVFDLVKVAKEINFIEGNGVFTTHIINWNSNDRQPDYLVVEGAKGEIVSRWYVLQNDFVSGTQYKQTLKRDTLGENFDEIFNAPVFIEKATLKPNDPAIYNKEDMSFNQIKTEETLLKDKSECAWLVGYVARDYNTKQDFTINTYYDEEYSSIEASPYAKFNHRTYRLASGSTHLVGQFTEQGDNTDLTHFTLGIYDTDYMPVRVDTDIYNNELEVNTVVDVNDDAYFAGECEARIRKYNLKYPDIIDTGPGGRYIDEEDESFIVSKNDKIIKIGDVYYRVELKREFYVTDYLKEAKGNSTYIYFNRVIGVDINANTCVYTKYVGRTIRADLIRMQNDGSNGKASLDFSMIRKKTVDQPFDMFCMPYADFTYKFPALEEAPPVIDVTKEGNLSIAMGLASLSGVIYDLQLLPYCPLINVPTGGVLDFTQYTYEDYGKIKLGSHTIGAVLWCDRSTFTFNIEKQIIVDNPKITNETEMYRLCSPNYNGAFEFNPAKNMVGNNKVAINYFNVDCTYKPFQPYIHINFDFKGLYGSDFNDARGLICGGDFSLPSVTDTWKSYEIQNKNYKASFDRQIESQELKNNVSRITDISQSAFSIFGAGVSGSILRGPGAGAALAGGAAIDSATNIATNEILRRDALDLTKDNFGFQMDNIKALPNTLNKVGSFNANNKIFPFLERYECTPEEKEALINKLKYNGMTVGRIGKIKDYLQYEETYVKGQLIMLDGVHDYAEIADASSELNMGVYTGLKNRKVNLFDDN